MSKERTVNFHFFKSIKGGSGKSAIAFFELVDNAICEYEGKTPDTEPRCCLVDADFRGSSLAILYEDYKSHMITDNGVKEDYEGISVKDTTNPKNEHKLKRANSEYMHYTDCMINNNEIYLENCCDRIQYREGKDISDFITIFEYDLFLCNPVTATKKAFTAYSSEHAAKSITIPFFKSYFKNFLLKLSTKYDNIFVDMSPGEDDLTNAIIQIVLDMNFTTDVKNFNKSNDGQETKSVNCHFNFISTTEAAHIAALQDTIVSFITERKHREKTVGIFDGDTVDVKGFINNVAPTVEWTLVDSKKNKWTGPASTESSDMMPRLRLFETEIDKRISSQHKKWYELCIEEFHPEYDMRNNSGDTNGTQLTDMAKARINAKGKGRIKTELKL